MFPTARLALWLAGMRCKSGFGEHASNNNPSHKQLMEKTMIVSVIFGSKLLSSFLMSAFHSFFTYRRCRQKQTVVTLKIHNSGLDRLGTDHFVTLSHPCLGFDRYFGNHRARSTNPPLCYVATSSISKLYRRAVVRADCGFVFANTQLFSRFV